MQARLVDGELAFLEHGNLTHYVIDTSHLYAKLSETCPRDQAHIPRTNDTDVHQLYSLY
jgi:hypothetical protein